MTTLYIAEKPDIGKAIATYLWPDGSAKREKNYITKGDTIVAWAAGHILRQAMPEEYDPEYKSWNHYEIFPKDWKLLPSADKKDLLTGLGKLLKKADVVIHAGDPDREGQLLIDEILKYYNYHGEVKRLLINAKDDVSMKRAFDSIEDNVKYQPLYEAGLARERADWLVGINLSRAYTKNARKHGYDATLRVGRVLIPTLALVVRREAEIKDFHSKDFYELVGTFLKDNIPFKAKLVPDDTLAVDEEGRILQPEILEAIKKKVRTAKAIISDIDSKKGSRQPPLPHSLDTLQVLANKKYDYSPKLVLDTVQSLYEKKYVSYPRSDCNYIPASQKDDASRIIPMLQNFGLPAAVMADLSLTSKAWNDSKVTAHHAIIPTGVEPQDLSDEESHIYELIATRYCLQFYKPWSFEKVSFLIQAAGTTFKGSGTITREKGFKAGSDDTDDKKEHDNVVLPALTKGDEVAVRQYEILKKKTKPPQRFTEGTLLSAMTNIWKFVAPDNPNREKLKEISGIGTPATRDSIISGLLMTKNKGHAVEPYIRKKGKELVPTDTGKNLIAIIDPSLTHPDTTAVMELSLAEIAQGNGSWQKYIDSVIAMVEENVHRAETFKYPAPPADKDAVPCPICQEGHLVRHHSKAKDFDFWICSNEDCKSPVTGKKVYYSDHDGKPVVAFCPHDAGVPLARWKGKFGYFWKCPKCNATFNEKDGQPDFTPKKKKGPAKPKNGSAY